ncbi:MAG: hypothetical protein BGP25_00075 [Lysobacterales bacterium 63-13]|nr:MAG: hypothetical protein BGP25_00075 [Xanthomonadales bacterium 63-13]
MPSIREVNANAHAAVQSLHADRVICRDLMPLDQPMTAEQQRQRARLIHSALLARKRMQLLRDRAEALAGALTRFQIREAQIAKRA